MQRNALCRSRRELSNAYFLAKFDFDTAENEPCKVCPIAAPRRVSGGVSEVDGKTGHAVDLLRAWVMANKEAPAHLELKVARSGGTNPELGS